MNWTTGAKEVCLDPHEKNFPSASREFAALTDREFEQTYWGPAWRMGRCRPRCRQSDWSPSVSAPAVSSAWCGDGGKRRSSRRWSAASTASRTLQSKQEVATHRTQGSLSWGQTWIECTNCIGIVKKCFDYCHRKVIYVTFFVVSIQCYIDFLHVYFIMSFADNVLSYLSIDDLLINY